MKEKTSSTGLQGRLDESISTEELLKQKPKAKPKFSKGKNNRKVGKGPSNVSSSPKRTNTTSKRTSSVKTFNRRADTKLRNVNHVSNPISTGLTTTSIKPANQGSKQTITDLVPVTKTASAGVSVTGTHVPNLDTNSDLIPTVLSTKIIGHEVGLIRKAFNLSSDQFMNLRLRLKQLTESNIHIQEV
jgi:hypothetical protein